MHNTAELLEAPPAPCVPQRPALDEETRRVLSEAKGLVANGWCKGAYKRGDKFCVRGAVIEAARIASGEDHPALRALYRTRGGSVTDWNDAPERTHAEVIDLFDKALTA